MKTLGLPLLLSLIPFAAACDSSGDADPVDGSSSTSGGSSDDDSTSDDGSTSDEGSTGGPDTNDALAACLALPEAAAAGWTPGTPGAPLAGSEDQIAVAGTATWSAGLQLLREVHPTGTVAVSPLSVMGGAALAYARHGEVCEGRLLDLVGFGTEGSALHDTFGALLAELGQRSMPAVEDGGDTVSAVEVLMTPESWTITDSIDEASIAPYGAAVHTLGGDDFAAMNEVINCAIETRTRGILKDFLPSSVPAADTTAVDLLVTYLAAPWQVAFEDAGDLAFEGPEGALSVPGISGTAIDGAALEDDDLLVATVPLRGAELEVTFVMPKSTPLSVFLQESTAASLIGLYEGTTATNFNLDMPRFETPLDAVDVLEPLGISCELFTVGSLHHGASVSIDAAGVAAAGAGAAESWNTGTSDGAELDLVLNRPFAFFIVDRPTRAMLFGGRFEG